MNPYLLLLIIYSLLLILAGVWLGRRVKTSADFFVANRQLGPGMLFVTMLAANIGAGSTVLAAGLGYRLGLSGWWWVGSAGIGSLLLAFTVGPRIWRIATDLEFYTVGDFLETRYGAGVRVLVTLLLWGGTLAILSGQLIAFAWILDVVAGTPKVLGCLLGGLVVLTYFVAGGLKGTVWINLVQLAVKMVGFLLSVPFAVAAVGGWETLSRQVSEGALPSGYLDITGIGLISILAYAALLIPSFIVSPGLLQKIYGARTENAVRWGVGLNGLALLLFSFLPVTCGIVAAVAFPGLENPELALPKLLVELIPLWLGGLLLAAVFSAEISSSDAILFMLSTSLSRDLYHRFLNPHATDRRLLTVSRRIAAVAGLLAVLGAILLPSVLDALSIFYGLLSVALFAPLLVGLYRRRPGQRTAVTAIATSVPAALLCHLLTAGSGIGPLSPTAFGILISLIVLLLGSLVSSNRPSPGR